MRWTKRWYLDIKGIQRMTFKKKHPKKGRASLHTQLPPADQKGLLDLVLQNGMLRIRQGRSSVLVAVVEDELKQENNEPRGRRMRVAKGFDLAVASAMCFLFYNGTSDKADHKRRK
ncbi:hypothetical protein PRZ48_003653 [Zasmidium cellare]|uniref:Uncharacterized protein n=1 Tax=Zasmidium cellare TaxID=395010 RepID=A0ABR0EXV5_ZASCE|nr:hypothetical protein PRZ48_003653 [Zasmidium cellare]